jgi:hypothetical protein
MRQTSGTPQEVAHATDRAFCLAEMISGRWSGSSLANAARHDAAVVEDGNRGHLGGLSGGEEDHHPGDLLGLGYPHGATPKHARSTSRACHWAKHNTPAPAGLPDLTLATAA